MASPPLPPARYPRIVRGCLARLVRRGRTGVAVSGTWALLGMARLAILSLPFRVFEPVIGRRQDAALPPIHLTLDEERIARRIGRLVGTAARFTAWDANCYAQALVAALLLRLSKVPYVFCFGLRRAGPGVPLLAHAWASAGPIVVTGGCGHETYVTVARLVGPRTSAS